MSRIGKLETIAPTLRRAAVMAPAVDSTIAAPATLSETPSAGPTSTVQIVSSLAVPVDPSEPIEIDNSKALGAGLISVHSLLCWLPSWSISLIGHVTLIILLTAITTGSIGNEPGLFLDGGVLKKDEIADTIEYEREKNEVETELLNIDVAALNSEASKDTAEVVTEHGVQVSLLEGDGSGFGMKDMADTGLTPVESEEEGLVAGKNEGKTTQFFGTEASGNRFVFIIDASGSMSEGFLWQRAVIELGKSLGKLDENQEVMVLLYNSHTLPMFNTVPAELKMLPVTDKFRVALGEWLTRQAPFGKTMPAHALKYGLSLRPDAIFLLSDGVLNDNSFEMLTEINRDHKTSAGEFNKVPIHTISLGPDELGVQLMRLIAETNDGDFVRVR